VHGRASSAWSAFKARNTIRFGPFLSPGGLIVLFGPPLGVS
jgi:prepilin signal peptidase PulO-like enzyme (type II secretory pathway)